MKYNLYLDGKEYPLDQVNMAKSSIPVRKPTTRGGVYFSDTTAYKIKAITNDLSLIPLISKVMLGPNTDFKPLEIKTSLNIDGKQYDIILVTHLTNTMNSSTKLELHLIVDKTKLE
ncbi:MAG: hypothetical protein HY222_04560 [Thaumarchaeota archaeon]|nr:hypothetical protein [Nitrososphaerota archaeon]MBI3641648.1 hypothetical protein [Nitrososphaerota archaeon]